MTITQTGAIKEIQRVPSELTTKTQGPRNGVSLHSFLIDHCCSIAQGLSDAECRRWDDNIEKKSPNCGIG